MWKEIGKLHAENAYFLNLAQKENIEKEELPVKLLKEARRWRIRLGC